jgi:hypothetical protein
MEKLGAGSLLQNMNPKYPYCLMGTKGGIKGTAIEATADTINSSVPGNVQQVALYEQLTPIDTVGSITSEIIGPSKGWIGFFNRKSGMDNPADSVTFSIIPLDKSGTPYPWLGFNEVNLDTLNISKIDATQYPFLQIKATFNDAKIRTTAQLDHWIITYLGVPEASVMTTKQMVIFKQDSVQEGDSAYMKIAFRNTSRYNMDSVLTVLSITNAFNQETELFRGKASGIASKRHHFL